MRNFDEKSRDMARSVLPSRAAKATRSSRRQIHHVVRARERAMLHNASKFLDDPDGFDRDAAADSRSAMSEMVSDRRIADNTAPLTRWAVRTVATNPGLASADLDVCMEHFRAILPNGTVGRHAASHIEWGLTRTGGYWEWWSFSGYK